jgi:hypothetical protein
VREIGELMAGPMRLEPKPAPSLAATLAYPGRRDRTRDLCHRLAAGAGAGANPFSVFGSC